ncbi:MAG: hypothetical protein QMC23_06950 [Rubritalea sp.]
MKTFKILTLLAVAAGSSLITSCGCCSGEEAVPSLRPLPNFKPIVPTTLPTTLPTEVDNSK